MPPQPSTQLPICKPEHTTRSFVVHPLSRKGPWHVPVPCTIKMNLAKKEGCVDWILQTNFCWKLFESKAPCHLNPLPTNPSENNKIHDRVAKLRPKCTFPPKQPLSMPSSEEGLHFACFQKNHKTWPFVQGSPYRPCKVLLFNHNATHCNSGTKNEPHAVMGCVSTKSQHLGGGLRKKNKHTMQKQR